MENLNNVYKYSETNDMSLINKRCSRCDEILTLDKFHKDPRYKKGVRGQCRKCLQELKSKRYYKNPDEYRSKMNEWIAKTPELTEKRRITAYSKYLIERGYSVVAP